MEDIREFAFVHGVTDYPEKPFYKTKLELAILFQVAAKLYPEKNFLEFDDRILTTGQVRQRCGTNAQHLILQKFKESDDVQTEWRKEFLDYGGGVYLVRGYKMIENGFIKLEISKARNEGQNYLHPTNTIEGSLKLMTRLLRGMPRDFLVPHYMHRGGYTPLWHFTEKLSSLIE
jgi:hypothetical protein